MNVNAQGYIAEMQIHTRRAVSSFTTIVLALKTILMNDQVLKTILNSGLNIRSCVSLKAKLSISVILKMSIYPRVPLNSEIINRFSFVLRVEAAV